MSGRARPRQRRGVDPTLTLVRLKHGPPARREVASRRPVRTRPLHGARLVSALTPMLASTALVRCHDRSQDGASRRVVELWPGEGRLGRIKRRDPGRFTRDVRPGTRGALSGRTLALAVATQPASRVSRATAECGGCSEREHLGRVMVTWTAGSGCFTRDRAVESGGCSRGSPWAGRDSRDGGGVFHARQSGRVGGCSEREHPGCRRMGAGVGLFHARQSGRVGGCSRGSTWAGRGDPGGGAGMFHARQGSAPGGAPAGVPERVVVTRAAGSGCFTRDRAGVF